MQRFGRRAKGLVVDLGFPCVEEIRDGNCLIRSSLPAKSGLSPGLCWCCCALWMLISPVLQRLPQLSSWMSSGPDAVLVQCLISGGYTGVHTWRVVWLEAANSKCELCSPIVHGAIFQFCGARAAPLVWWQWRWCEKVWKCSFTMIDITEGTGDYYQDT